MDKYSAFVWKAARQQVAGLPACPADLTEQEYANLVFYARCHVRSDSLGLNCSEMSYRLVGNARQLFSGMYVADSVHAAKQDGKIPLYFMTGKFTGKKGFAFSLPVIR